MSLFCGTRLLNKQLLVAVNRIPAAITSANYAQAAPKITYKPYVPPPVENYDDKNARTKRPMSPHLTIYAPQMTSLMSGTHRVGGMILSGYIAAIGLSALVLPNDISYYISILESLNLSSFTIFFGKALLAAPFGYHFTNGLRHLYWDTGRGLSIKEVYSTGYLILAVSAIITLGLALL